ncbi:unnamed protein product [Mytilus coruscus]|uniref:Uncharacterized protein n=1 Tax=Mytilus coruscus TaxID=42192 RepID=A0A6J8E836_MYTCO|nr:unnamed protein product [Mytilus coruscus]
MGSQRFERFSDWNKLVDTIARLQHIAESYQGKAHCHHGTGWHLCRESLNLVNSRRAEINIIKAVQAETYTEELLSSVEGKNIPANSPLNNLLWLSVTQNLCTRHNSSRSVKSSSSRRSGAKTSSSRNSSASSVYLKSKAKAEAAKVCLQYVQEEAELKKKQASLDEQFEIETAKFKAAAQKEKAELNADLEVLAYKKDAAAAEAEVEVLQSERSEESTERSCSGIKSIASKRTQAYVDEQSSLKSHHSVSQPGKEFEIPYIVPSTRNKPQKVFGIPYMVPSLRSEPLLPTNHIHEETLIMKQAEIQNKTTEKIDNSCFAEFFREQSKIKNNPSVMYEYDSVVTNRKEKGNSRNVNVATKKTELQDNSRSTERSRDEKQCPIHITNHTLNKCRAFRNKPIDERRKLLKDKNICFGYCESNTHIQRNCPSSGTVQCDICKSNHATALHKNVNTLLKALSSNGRESVQNPEPSSTTPVVKAMCSQVCGDYFAGKSCAKTVLVTIYQKNQCANAVRGNNPADQATRSIAVKDLQTSMWLHGPTRTICENSISETEYQLQDPSEDKEIRNVSCLKTKFSDISSMGSQRFERFSDWNKLVDTIARLQHIAESYQGKAHCLHGRGWHLCREFLNLVSS